MSKKNRVQDGEPVSTNLGQETNLVQETPPEPTSPTSKVIDPLDPKNHGKPLWVVYGSEAFPQIICAKLLAYDVRHKLLPVGVSGPNINIWGYSVFEGEPGFRTIGSSVGYWGQRSTLGPFFYDEQIAALEHLCDLTTPTLKEGE